MITKHYQSDDVKTAAEGHWLRILPELTILNSAQLDGGNYPCPSCGGSDRFNACRKSFEQSGQVYCNKGCGLTGDGFAVLMHLNGWDFVAAVSAVDELLMTDGATSANKRTGTERTKRTTNTLQGMSYPDAITAVLRGVRRSLTDHVTIADEPTTYDYRDATGRIVGVVLRWDRSDGEKEIRQLSVTENGWQAKAMAEPRPLFNLPKVLKADTVYLCEGEKAVQAIESFGLVATTSAGGSSAPTKTDWSVLDGKTVVIVPDHDEPGRKYRDKVAALITAQAAAAKIRLADLSDCWPDIPEKGDAADWSTQFDAKPIEWFQAELERIAKLMVQQTVRISEKPASKTKKVLENEFHPLPISCLPDALKEFVQTASPALGVDNAFLVLPILAVCAAAIGHSRSLMIKRGWFVPSILWTAVVGESGCGKSPAFRVAVQPLKDLQREHSQKFNAEKAQYNSDCRQWKRDFKQWEKRGEGEEPQRPIAPVHRQVLTSDSTVEGLAPVLSENERGIILARDELSHWLTSFDKYSGKGATSSNVTNWLEFYNAEFSIINRKSQEQRVLTLERPSVSVTGGIQPGILAKCLTTEHKENGLSSRLMLAYPPRQPKRWRDEELSQAHVSAYAELIRQLYELKPDTDSQGNAKPALLRLNDDARRLMVQFVNAHGVEQNALQGHAASQWSKLEEIPARFAIVIHCVRQVTDRVEDAFAVDGFTMAAAIELAEWLKAETLRINLMLVEDEDTRNARQLAEWIATNHSGRITAAKLRDYRRDIETTDQAELLLINLIGLGFGCWQNIHKSREFVLQSA